MSYRRSLSFAEDEKELLEYYDQNGKSDIGKVALKYYRDNKDKILCDDVLEVLKHLNINTQTTVPLETHINQNKLSKLIK